MRGRKGKLVAAACLVAILVLSGPGSGAAPTPPSSHGALDLRSAYRTVYYASSVDGTNLSYYEWLPAAYNASHAYPLAVYLHGLGYSGSELLLLTEGTNAIANASRDGFLLISINTRTSDGFYVNSPYSGPQEQDVIDAIHHEEAIRDVNASAVYLFGSSMGTMGAWSIAGHHPGLVRGIGAVAECPETFMAVYYHALIGQSLSYLTTTGGYAPNQSAYALAQTYYLDSARYYPQNYSNVTLYAVQGGADDRCPNNPHLFGYQQSNNTFLNSTCLVLANWSQPANCQTPFANLSRAHPGEYRWRFVYEPTGIHSLNDLNPEDMFEFWLGQEPAGLYCAVMGTTPVGCPGAPAVGPPTADPAALDVGRPLRLSADPVGGTPPYTYAWLGLPPGCVSANTSALNCTPSSPGTFAISVGVTDAARAQNASPVTGVTVNPSFRATGSATPNGGIAPLTVTVASTLLGGTSPISTLWSFGDGSRASAPNATHTYLVPGNFSLSGGWTDASGETGSFNATISVVPGPFVVQGPAASPASVDAGQNVTFNVTALGGTPGYTYTWSGLPAPCAPADRATIACSPTTVGHFAVNVTVADSAGHATPVGPLAFDVATDPTAGAPAAARTALDAGQATNLSVAVQGGVAPYAVRWTGAPPGCSAVSGPVEACAATTAGTFTLAAVVTDANGYTVAAPGTLTLRVGPALRVGPVTLSPSGTDIGRPANLVSTVTGGSSPYRFAWNGLPPGCASRNATSVACTPAAVGNASVSLTVTDANGNVATSPVYGIAVHPLPILTGLGADPSSPTAGARWNLLATVVGGSAPYRWSYAGLPADCAATAAPPVACSSGAAGAYSVVVSVEDAAGANATATVAIEVVAPAGGLPFGLTESAALGVAVVTATAAIAAAGALALRARSRRRRRAERP